MTGTARDLTRSGQIVCWVAGDTRRVAVTTRVAIKVIMNLTIILRSAMKAVSVSRSRYSEINLETTLEGAGRTHGGMPRVAMRTR